MKKLIPICAFGLLTACGPVRFTPTEYPIAKEFITQIDLNGVIKVTNGQPSEENATVYSYGGTKLFSTLKILTDSMVQQTIKEIEAHSIQKNNNKTKTIELKVDSLLSKYAFMYWNSTLVFTAKLGNSKTVTKTILHTSGILQQDLNGCMADGVVQLLADPEVKAYFSE